MLYYTGNMRSDIKFTLITAVLTSLSLLIRLDYWSWYERFGFYQGDIWYFYTFYGDQILHDPFFAFDYPVGYILILKLSGFLSLLFGQFSYQSFLIANALLIIPAASACTWLLYKIATLIKLDHSRLLIYFILSPSLFLYSTINYDIFPVLFTLLSIYLILMCRYNLSALSLSLAVVIKLYPFLFLPVIIFYLLNQKISSIKITAYLGIFILALMTINFPFITTNLADWIYPFLHQSTNPERNDPTTLSYYLTTISLGQFRTLFWISLVSISWIISYTFYKVGKLSSVNFIYLLLLTALSIVVGNHVYTPQYFLWFLPYVALLNKPVFWIWLPFDLLNASTRFFYFKFKTEWPEIFQTIHSTNIIFLACLYLLVLYAIKLRFQNAKN